LTAVDVLTFTVVNLFTLPLSAKQGPGQGCAGFSTDLGGWFNPRTSKLCITIVVDRHPVTRDPVVSSAMGLIAALSGQSALLLCGVLGLYYVVRVIANYAKLRKFRGPAWTGVSNWPHSMAMLSLNCHEWYAEVSRKYGARHSCFVLQLCAAYLPVPQHRATHS
jgi:hypothetical protein